MEGHIRVFRSGLSSEKPPQEAEEVEDGDDDGGWGAADKETAIRSKIEEDKALQGSNLLVSIAPCMDVPETGDYNTNVAVTLNVPDLTSRVAVDICCVIDISGSMGEDATFQDPADENRKCSEGLSQLDIVKHAVKTIMHTLTENDRFTLIAFDSRADLVFPLSPMTEEGLMLAVFALEDLRPCDSTNIWAGLELGLDSLRTSEANAALGNAPRKCSLFLLTDGQPSESPANGEAEALRGYFQSHRDFSCQVNTFGFGYSLKSKMLLELAREGNGTFAFIPDAKIVGTCFVNAIANACSNMSPNCTITLAPKNGASFAGPIGGCIPFQEAGPFQIGQTRVAKIGPLQFGQARDIVVPLNFPNERRNDQNYLEVKVEYESSIDGLSHSLTVEGNSREVTSDSIVAALRNLIVSTVTQVITLCEENNYAEGARNMLALVGQALAFSTLELDPRVKALNEDVSGRMSKAVSTSERFQRWGAHYLRAVVRSHQIQLRTNFMDPGLQLYGGSLFHMLEARGGEIFIALPLTRREDYGYSLGPPPAAAPPQYAPAAAVSPSAAVVAPPPPAEIDISTYYSGGGGGCFDASSTVLVKQKEGTKAMRVSQVRKGDRVCIVDENGELAFTRVLCVVQLTGHTHRELVEFPSTGLKITAKHPVKYCDKWCYPKDLLELPNKCALKCKSSSDLLFNFLLESGHLLLVNNIPCPTFAHGFSKPDFLWHPFYATQLVSEQLQQLPGFDIGLVSVAGSLRQRE